MIVCLGLPQRNTKCYEVMIGGDTFYFSYSTIVAASTQEGRFRRDNKWGPTTGRHMNDMNVRNFTIVSEEEMDRVVRTSILRTGQRLALTPLEGRT